MGMWLWSTPPGHIIIMQAVGMSLSQEIWTYFNLHSVSGFRHHIAYKWTWVFSFLQSDLSRRFNAPDETEEDNTPGYSQATQDRKTNLSKVPNIIRDVQHVVPEREKETNRVCLDNSQAWLTGIFFRSFKLQNGQIGKNIEADCCLSFIKYVIFAVSCGLNDSWPW